MQQRNPIPANEAERVAALKHYEILDTVNEEEFERLTQLASLICGVPIALVGLIDENRQWYKSILGLGGTEVARELSFCQYTIMGDGLMEVTDATKDDRFVDSPFVTDDPNVRFYAGYPLTDPNGMNLGSLCVIDRTPKKLDDNQIKALELLAKEVVSQIVGRKQNLDRIKLEQLFNFSLDLTCIAGTDGFFKRVNPMFTKVLGWSEEEMLRIPFLDLIHEDDREKTLLEIEKLARGEKTLNFENRYRKKDGEYVILSWIANPDTETGELFSVARDITEKVRVLKELEEAKLAAEKSAKVKDEFLSNMSHEIRTPLNAIIGFNDLLKQSSLTPEQEKHVEIVKIASQNLMVIINDVLDISKLESGILELEQRPINLREVVENVIHLQAPKAKSKGIKLLLNIDQELPPTVVGDSTRITQVLINLIGNAVKFTEEGYVELKVIEMARKGENSLVRFTVKDTGIGIEKEKQEAIFERFSQAESSTTRLFGGTGLGLNIAKMLVEMHDSKLELESVFGKGSEFYFEILFPIITQLEKQDEAGSKLTLMNRIKGLRILVVEDNEHNQILVNSYLKKNGALVEMAGNGALGVEKLKEKTYDLVLMDLQMPVMDGFTATNLIRNELNLSLPIIACSAHSLVGEREKCIEKGMNDYISKPYSENTLVSVLSSFFEDNESQDKEQQADIPLDDFETILKDTETEHGKEFVEIMLEVYTRRIPSDIKDLESALQNKDSEAIKAKAHLLTGSLSSLNFDIGHNLAKQAERTAQGESFEKTKVDTRILIAYLKTSLKEIN